MKFYKYLIGLLILASSSYAQFGSWGGTTGTASNADTTRAETWDSLQTFTRGIDVKDDAEFDSLATFRYKVGISGITTHGTSVKFDSAGNGAMSNAAYLDFTLADNASASIYWLYASSTNYWTTDGNFKFSKTGYIGSLYFNGTYRYIGLATSGPKIKWDQSPYYLTLDTDDGAQYYPIRIGCTDNDAFTTFDSSGVGTFPIGGLKITPGAIPGSPVEGQFCLTTTGDSLGVYLASGWKWFIAGE